MVKQKTCEANYRNQQLMSEGSRSTREEESGRCLDGHWVGIAGIAADLNQAFSGGLPTLPSAVPAVNLSGLANEDAMNYGCGADPNSHECTENG